MNYSLRVAALRPTAALVILVSVAAGCNMTGSPRVPAGAPRPMLVPEPGAGFAAQVLLTTGDTVGDYRPPGVLDGMVPFAGDDAESMDLFVTHELEAGEGAGYRLANGTELAGSRITRFTMDRRSRRITSARLAYREVRDRGGRVVTDAAQLNETGGRGAAGLRILLFGVGLVRRRVPDSWIDS